MNFHEIGLAMQDQFGQDAGFCSTCQPWDFQELFAHLLSLVPRQPWKMRVSAVMGLRCRRIALPAQEASGRCSQMAVPRYGEHPAVDHSGSSAGVCFQVFRILQASMLSPFGVYLVQEGLAVVSWAKLKGVKGRSDGYLPWPVKPKMLRTSGGRESLSFGKLTAVQLA